MSSDPGQSERMDAEALERALIEAGVSRADALDWIEGRLESDAMKRVEAVLARSPELARPMIGMRADRRRLGSTPTPAAPRELIARSMELALGESSATDAGEALAAATSDELAALRVDLATGSVLASGRRRRSAWRIGGYVAAAAAVVLTGVVLLPVWNASEPIAGPELAMESPVDAGLAPAARSAPQVVAPTPMAAAGALVDETLAKGDDIAPAEAVLADAGAAFDEMLDDVEVSEVVGARVIDDPVLASSLAREGRLALRLTTRRPDRTGVALARLGARRTGVWSLSAPIEAANAPAPVLALLDDAVTGTLRSPGRVASVNRTDEPNTDRQTSERAESETDIVPGSVYLVRTPPEELGGVVTVLAGSRWSEVEYIELPEPIAAPTRQVEPSEALWWLDPPKTWPVGVTVPLIVESR
ncbi:MAG: hypothetical protein AAGK04_04350 [Planctomycetota bacterium]